MLDSETRDKVQVIYASFNNSEGSGGHGGNGVMNFHGDAFRNPNLNVVEHEFGHNLGMAEQVNDAGERCCTMMYGIASATRVLTPEDRAIVVSWYAPTPGH
jgi:hypothetical protein